MHPACDAHVLIPELNLRAIYLKMSLPPFGFAYQFSAFRACVRYINPLAIRKVLKFMSIPPQGMDDDCNGENRARIALILGSGAVIGLYRRNRRGGSGSG
jgi:hypothetical protein